MIDRFFILGHGENRPDAKRIVFCDGSGGEIFQHETDLELSHWRPNHTPLEYRAGTSTEICFRFLDHPRPGPWSLAVNNHLDVDGILSVYTLVHSEHAQANRQTIIQAAEIGDFWGWGEWPAQHLFQGLTLLMEEGRLQEKETVAIYAEAFDRVPAWINGIDPWSEKINASLEPLRVGVMLVVSGAIHRETVDSRLTSYTIPMAVTSGDIGRATYVPRFNEKISSNALLWPQVRARWDEQRMSLVSVEAGSGWHHALWYPGYLWADTDNRWVVPGMHYHNGMESYEMLHPPFADAVRQLNELETAGGIWTFGDPVFDFGLDIQSDFPIAVRVLNEEGSPISSSLSPQQVIAQLAGVFSVT